MKYLFLFLLDVFVFIESVFIDMICPLEWRYGINFYDDYDSVNFPILNQSWSNSSSYLSEAPELIFSGNLYRNCLLNASYSPINWCRKNINSIYQRFLSVNISNNLLTRIVCYHLCLNIVNNEFIRNHTNLQVCPSPCHQKNICTQLDSAAIECMPTRTVIFSHDFKCSCKFNSYWDSHRQRCARLNPCDSEKYYPCYRPGTAWCVYNEKESTHECQCNIDYVGYKCSDQYNPCRHVSHKQHIITISYPGDRVCNVNNGNKCISQKYTYKCQCSSSWRADSRFPYDNCLLKITKCHSKICVKGQCLYSLSGEKGYCKCLKDWGGENCNKFVGSWTDWSRWDRCRPSCGNHRWTMRTRECNTEITSVRKDCDGSAVMFKQCQNRKCAHEIENLMMKIFEIRYSLFFGCLLANLTIGLITVIVWKILFYGSIRFQLRLFIQIIGEYFSHIQNTAED